MIDLNSNHTDTIRVEKSKEDPNVVLIAELEEFSDEINQIHGTGNLKRCYYSGKRLCVETNRGEIVFNERENAL